MIAIDTNVFIYLLNGDPVFGPRAAAILRSLDEKMASELVFAEILASSKLEPASLRRKALDFLEALRITYHPVSREILIAAGDLRRKYTGLKLADAMQVATALKGGADCFVTNDLALTRLHVAGLDIRPL